MEALGIILFLGLIFWIFSLFSKSSSSAPKQTTSTSNNIEKELYNAGLANDFFEKGNYQEAIEYYTIALSYNQLSSYLNNRALSKSNIYDFNGAKEDYNSAINLSPENARYWCNRGTLFFNNAKYEEAISDWEKAADLGSSGAKANLEKHADIRLLAKISKVIDKLSSEKKEKSFEDTLIGTEWVMKCFDEDIEDKIIKFDRDGKLIFANFSDNSKNSWSSNGDTVTLKVNNGYSTYQGTIEEYVYKGEASNINGDKWMFEAVLNKNLENDCIDSSYSESIEIESDEGPKDKRELISDSLKRDNWREFEKVINENKISTLYHFTDYANLQSIKRHGALFSWQYCVKNHITIPVPGGDQLSRSLDKRHKVQNYVRVSFTKNHPMMFTAQNQGRINNPVVLEIDPEVIYWENTKYANKNATRQDVKIGTKLEDFKRIRFDIIRLPTHFDVPDNAKSFFQAEILVLEQIPIEFIKNIYSL